MKNTHRFTVGSLCLSLLGAPLACAATDSQAETSGDPQTGGVHAAGGFAQTGGVGGFVSTGGTAGAAPSACLPGQTECPEGCVALSSSVTNCGACGSACAVGQACRAGSCECSPGLVDCGAGCTDISSDGQNCGSCGNDCGDAVCSGGVCTTSCRTGETQCGHSCVDTATSATHCGACDVVCSLGQSCVQGACACPDGQTDCGGLCVDPSTSPVHCGSCGTACAEGQFCSAGTCQSGAGGAGGAGGTGGTGFGGTGGTGFGGTGGTGGTGGSTTCAVVDEGESATLTCPPGTVISSVEFASYGDASGSCGAFQTGSCHATTSEAIVASACLGQNGCTLSASNDVFGDPCNGTEKSLSVEIACGAGGSGGATGGSGGATGGSMGDCPTGLVGWATTGPGTTGGGNVTPLVVTSYSELSSAMSGSDPRVVHLSGSVDTGSNSLTIGSNKTLKGLDKSARIVGGISVRGSNVIVQNLTVQGKGQGNSPADAINSTGASNLWFDHLNVLDGGDGILDLTNGSDRATVSWCKFWYTDPSHTHRLALLFGNGSEKCDVDGGKQNHTIHHNWFADLVDQRMPRLLFGQGHVFNNYYNSPGNGYCVGSGSWASILIENNYYKDVNSPHKFQDGHPSYIAATGNVYDNTSGSRDTGSRPAADGPSNDCERALPVPGPWTPPYSYALDAAESIPELVMRCAGPQ